MNERLIVHHITVSDPDDALGTLGDGEAFYTPPVAETIVYVCAAPRDDDQGTVTIAIQNVGADIITGIDASDADVPGTWTSTHFGGDETPVAVAGGSKVEFDFTGATAANQYYITIYALTGEVAAVE